MSIGGLSSDIANALEEMTEELEREIESASSDVMKEGLKKIKLSSPKSTKKYSKSWKVKLNKNTGKRTLYNKDEYRLTHLLEFGHVKRGGGRTEAFPHIAETEKYIVDEYEERIKQAIAK